MKLRHIPFILLAAIIVILMAATFVEKSQGNEVATETIYASWWMTGLWAVTVAVSLWVIVRSGMVRRPATLLLHLSFVVILAGALITHLWGSQGSTHLRSGLPQAAYQEGDEGLTCQLPFSLTLRQFTVETYPGTTSPMDYVSVIDVVEQAKTVTTLQVSMNHIGEYRGYRFYQSGYDEDGEGTILSVSHDPWGIGVSYTGYGLLFLSMLLFLILPNEGFRRLLRQRPAVLLLLCLVSVGLSAAPKTLPKKTAAKFGNLYTYYNGRICPIETVARDFTTKLYGKPTYKGLTAEQVLTGWIFYPTDWIGEPIIKVKGRARDIVGTKKGYACYNDFFNTDGYKLDRPISAILRGEQTDGAQSIREADEKMNILRMLFNGQLLKMYPYRTDHLAWFSQGDHLPQDMPEEKWTFTKKSMDYAGELVWMKRWNDLDTLIGKLRTYQEKEAAGLLPTVTMFKAERLYNRSEHTRPLAMLLLTAGIVLFFVCLSLWLRQRKPHKGLTIAAGLLLVASLAYLLFIIGLRTYISGHLPLSNGYETMQAMAVSTLLLTLLFQRRFQMMLPFGLLIAGLTLLVAMMGESNPQITPLMPVLASPLLSIHVCIIMLAYSLLAFTCLNSLTALGLQLFRSARRDACPSKNVYCLLFNVQRTTSLLLYPAVFCLAAGIFIGAIWANQSWGRYWGWDPKEVWALITLLVYSVPLHRQSIPWLQKTRAFHIYIVLAFLSILMTYFGVNFFLGGMHSYA